MRKAKIRNRLILNYLFLILLPIVIISWVIINVYSSSMMEIAEESAKKSLEQINSRLTEQVLTLEQHLSFMEKDTQVTAFFEKGNLLIGHEKEKLKTLLKGYSDIFDNVSFIGLVNVDGYVNANKTQTDWDDNRLKQDWFLHPMQNPGETYIEPFHVGESPFEDAETRYTDVVMMSRAVKGDDGKSQGVIAFLVTKGLFDKALQNLTPITDGYFYITDTSQKIVYSPLSQKIIEPRDEAKYDLVKKTSDVSGWTIWGVIPIQNLLSRLSDLQLLLFIVFGGLLIGLIAVAAVTSNAIVHPLKELEELMKKAEKGDFKLYFEYKGNDEIGDLCAGYNTMIDKIDQLLGQVYQEQRNKRKAEIEALQSHIRPHFLYNTLDTIHWMSKKYNANDVIETVDALATLFRIGLSKGEEVITLEKEIEHVKSYLKIQKARYSDIMDYEIYVQNGLESYYVQKIILQPFIENALYHGIKESDKKGHITIEAKKDEGNLKIIIKDDGLGIDPNELEMLRWTLKEGVRGKSYGILNVNQRLRLSYGEEYGVKVDSVKNQGTIITIIHPIIETMN